MSPRSSEFLNQALENLEMNDVHQLKWGSTRMASFLNACIRTSIIILPFFDVMVNANICSDASMVLLSPKVMQSSNAFFLERIIFVLFIGRILDALKFLMM